MYHVNYMCKFGMHAEFSLKKVERGINFFWTLIYRVILSVLDPRKCEYLKDYSLDFEHAYMNTCLASS